jgi:hypothetical protein
MKLMTGVNFTNILPHFTQIIVFSDIGQKLSDGNLVPVVLDLVPKPNFSSKFSTRKSLVPELVPRLKSSAKFSAMNFFFNYQKLLVKLEIEHLNL